MSTHGSCPKFAVKHLPCSAGHTVADTKRRETAIPRVKSGACLKMRQKLVERIESAFSNWWVNGRSSLNGTEKRRTHDSPERDLPKRQDPASFLVEHISCLDGVP